MTASPPYRPMLIPGLSRVWRDEDTLQLGTGTRRGIVLSPAAGTAGELLDLVDGTRSESTILRHARRLGLAEEEARALLTALHEAGLLLGAHHFLPALLTGEARTRLSGEAASIALGDAGSVDNPARVLRRRYTSGVAITGPGPAAGPIAVALAQAGIGRIHADLTGPVLPTDRAGGAVIEDDGRARAVRAAIARVAPDVRTGPLPRGHTALVIQLGMDRPAPVLAAGFAQRRQAHLLVGARDGTMVVGPLVPAAGVPCLRCLDLHRRDRDPAWPALAAQLMPRPGDEPPAGGAATVLAAAAYAVEQVLAHLDGGAPETIGAATEIDGPSRMRRRRWAQHPSCDCGRRHRRSPSPQPGTVTD
ncbi:bacteriocin biosynthesis cyclodehydratase domain-containing protein [Catenuloplanes nepalensis]|uniref:Bacteriocin biosynthesis cyclodehydratase domain-containing protein n=1 Tax=Catenuloplanes nepalensis TaxID=587533 RepID=A0ABT9N1T8_9ACTN|nr:hypothetical protein [Catenuloplanes nepalensis]MDP9797657.1 bacteriocin biosynthesis cyclodehydratase domain-containing protein [Catenuloplanes nepalensis]